MKKWIVMLALAAMSFTGHAYAAFYDNSSQYMIASDTMEGKFYLDRSSIHQEEPTESNPYAIRFAILSVPRNGGMLERTWYTVYYDKANGIASYQVIGADALDADGNVSGITSTRGAGAMKRAIPLRSNMYYLADACYLYFNHEHFYSRLADTK